MFHCTDSMCGARHSHASLQRKCWQELQLLHGLSVFHFRYANFLFLPLSPPSEEHYVTLFSFTGDFVLFGLMIIALEEGMKKEGKEDEYAWLVQIDTPDDLHMRPGSYTGPTIRV